MIRILFLFVLFFGSMSFLHAQRVGNLAITVHQMYRNAKIPLDSALVTVINLNDSTAKQMGVTNSNGAITFRIPNGLYLVSVTKTNYVLTSHVSYRTWRASPRKAGKIQHNRKAVYAYIKVRGKKTVTLEPVMQTEKPKKVKKEVRLVPVKDD